MRRFPVSGKEMPILRPNRRAGECSRLNGLNGDQDVALVRGLDENLVPDLWNFPSAFGSSPGEAFNRLQQRLMRAAGLAVQWNNDSPAGGRPLLRLHHRITHRSIIADVYGAKAVSDRGHHMRWFPLGSLKKAAVSRLTRKIAISFEALTAESGGEASPQRLTTVL
jgi:hypothetical protein